MRGGADDPGLSKERQSEATMTDRAGSPAYQMLPRSARRVFAAIERAIEGAGHCARPVNSRNP